MSQRKGPSIFLCSLILCVLDAYILRRKINASFWVESPKTVKIKKEEIEGGGQKPATKKHVCRPPTAGTSGMSNKRNTKTPKPATLFAKSPFPKHFFPFQVTHFLFTINHLIENQKPLCIPDFHIEVQTKTPTLNRQHYLAKIPIPQAPFSPFQINPFLFTIIIN